MRLRNKKTGEVIDLSEGFIKDTYNGEFIQIKPVAISNKEGYLYGSLAELNEEWEDYEPLIKDEKIRKAVRAWAEVNAIEKALYAEKPNRSLCGLTDMGDEDYSIEFVGWIPTLKDGEEYTIAELCGEDEAPEPIEPTFVDLDERIKGKEGK